MPIAVRQHTRRGKTVRGHYRLRHRAGSVIKAGTSYGQIAYVKPSNMVGDHDAFSIIYVEPSVTDTEFETGRSRLKGYRYQLPHVLAHETVHQVVARLEGEGASRGVDRLTRNDDKDAVGDPSYADLNPRRFGHLSERQMAFRNAAARIEQRKKGR